MLVKVAAKAILVEVGKLIILFIKFRTNLPTAELLKKVKSKFPSLTI
jgi:hypothetical protein